MHCRGPSYVNKEIRKFTQNVQKYVLINKQNVQWTEFKNVA